MAVLYNRLAIVRKHSGLSSTAKLGLRARVSFMFFLADFSNVEITNANHPEERNPLSGRTKSPLFGLFQPFYTAND